MDCSECIHYWVCKTRSFEDCEDFNGGCEWCKHSLHCKNSINLSFCSDFEYEGPVVNPWEEKDD